MNVAQAQDGRPAADGAGPSQTGQGALASPSTAASTFLLAQQTEQKKPASPFEDVPDETPGQEPASPFEDVQEDETAGQRGPREDVIENVEFRGARRISRDGLLARIFSKPGDTFEEASLRRDFMVLWNTG